MLFERVMAWIFEHGPADVSMLIRQAGFNYSTMKPILYELVKEHLLRRDEKPRAKQGNPIYYHITPRGARFVRLDWDRMSLLDRAKATCQENYADLGIVSDLLTSISLLKEPGLVKSILWVALFISGLALLVVGNVFGSIFILISAVLFYDDYVRERPGLDRPITTSQNNP